MKETIKEIIGKLFGHGISMTRLLSFLVIVDIMAVWTFECLKTWKIADIPNGVVAIFGLMITGKAVQKFAEKSTDEKKDIK
jgi:hypothetical protein